MKIKLLTLMLFLHFTNSFVPQLPVNAQLCKRRHCQTNTKFKINTNANNELNDSDIDDDDDSWIDDDFFTDQENDQPDLTPKPKNVLSIIYNIPIRQNNPPKTIKSQNFEVNKKGDDGCGW